MGCKGARRMKRYDTKITVTDPPFPGTLTFGEMKEGRFVYHADLHAWALKHKQTVEGMRCGVLCQSELCETCNADVDLKTERPIRHHSHMSHEAKRMPCNCPRRDALREIEEIINGN